MADTIIIPEAAHYIVMDVGGSGGGQEGNGITSITQPEPLVMRVATRDFTNDFELFAGEDGRSITGTTITAGRLIITYSDSTTQDAGAVTAITLMQIVGNDLVVTYNNGTVVNLGRVVGTDGTNGNTILSGAGVPNSNQGVPGDFYLRTSNYELFGPKVDGHWSANGVIIKGRTLLNGTTIPNNSDGSEGDFYLRTTNSQLYGPKVGNDWGSGVSLIGNGITAITQPSANIMRVATRDLAPVDITLIAGTNGSTWYQSAGTPSVGIGVNGDYHLNTVTQDVSQKQIGAWVFLLNIKGATGADGPSSLLPFLNKTSFIDHLMPVGVVGSVATTNFQAAVFSGAGTVAFRNDQTIGLGGQIRLSTGTGTNTDLNIRRASGLSGNRIGTTPIDYVFLFYADTLQTSGDVCTFRLCAQNNINANQTAANRTGFYVDFSWQTDGVKAAFSCFNNTVSTVVNDSLALATNTLYAVRVRVSSTTAQLFINGTLRQTINTNLPVFQPIQMGVALIKGTGSTSISYTLDALASEATATQNVYTL